MAESSPSRATRFPALLTVFLIVFIDLMGFGIIIPTLTFYVPNYQQNPLKVTLLFSIYSLCQFIGAPVLGLISDRVGRKPVLSVSQAGSAVGYLLLGLATQIHWADPRWILVMVYLSRIIDGFTGGNISTAQAYITDVTAPKERARGMALLGLAFGIGFSAGPFLGGVLGKHNPALPAYVACAFSAVAAILSATVLPESRPAGEVEAEAWLHPARFKPVFRHRALVQLLLISFVTMAAFVMMESTIGLLLNRTFGWMQGQLGWFFGYAGLIIIIVQGGLIGRLTKRFGDWPLAMLGPMLVAVGMLGYARFAYAPGMALLLGTAAVNTVGRSFQMPTLSSLISKYSPSDLRGVTFGLYQGLGSLARFVGPLIAGLAYPHLRGAGPYVTGAVLAAAGGIWTVWVRMQAVGLAET